MTFLGEDVSELSPIYALALVCGLILGAAFVGGCASFSADDRAALDQSTRLSAAGYKYQDAGTPGAALDRANYCAIAGLERRQHLPVFDAGIECTP